MACAHYKRGFTLVEAIIALFILSTAVVFATIVIGTVKITRDAALENSAFHIAENKLNELRALGYATLPSSGPFFDPEIVTLPGGSASTSITDWNTETKRVMAGVSWIGTDGASRFVSLTTLVTEVGGL